MIHNTQGNLLDTPVQALVNAVNIVGVMGKSIALMFKERFPNNRTIYGPIPVRQPPLSVIDTERDGETLSEKQLHFRFLTVLMQQRLGITIRLRASFEH